MDDPTVLRSQPKYEKLREQLVRHLAGLPQGSRFPTERELCRTYEVSRATVRQALQRLEAEQRIYRHQGKGTFVARPKIEQILELTSHTEDMKARGIVPGSKLIDVRRIEASAEVAAMLELDAASEVLRIERVRLGDGEPIALEVVFVDAHRFDGLSDALGDSASLYQLLETAYGVELALADQTIEAVVADERAVDLLGTAMGAPLLLLSRRTLDVKGTPTEFVQSLYRGDRFRFRTQIGRRQSTAAKRGDEFSAAPTVPRNTPAVTTSRTSKVLDLAQGRLPTGRDPRHKQAAMSQLPATSGGTGLQ
ncbi:MAG: GntR family transcriptional regulator [Acidimicrobiales bacterium]